MKNRKKCILYSTSSDASAAFVNLQTHNENLQGNLPEDENELGLLCVEETLVNQNFLRGCTIKDKKETKVNEKIGNYQIIDLPVMYRYKRIELAGSNVVYTRLPYDSYVEIGGQKQYVLVKSLNAIEGSKWLKNWEANKSLVLNGFYKENKSIIYKWLLQAKLVGAPNIKLAIALRRDSKERDEHKIIGVEDVKVNDLANFLGFNFETSMVCLNLILESLVNIEEDGEYIINKTAFKPSCKLMKIIEADSEDSEDVY